MRGMSAGEKVRRANESMNGGEDAASYLSMGTPIVCEGLMKA